MKSLYVLSAIAVLGFYGCQDGGSGSANIAGTDDEPLDIPSGTFALFVSLSMDSRNLMAINPRAKRRLQCVAQYWGPARPDVRGH